MARNKSWADEDRVLRASWARGEVPWETVATADIRHSTYLERYARRVGWRVLFEDGEMAGDVWRIVQHSNRRLAFQRRCLAEWKDERPLVPEWQIAFLEDRVALCEGRPQIYGSQFQRTSDDSWKLWPTTSQSVQELDVLRTAAGLQPFGEYCELMTGETWPEDAALPHA